MAYRVGEVVQVRSENTGYNGPATVLRTYGDDGVSVRLHQHGAGSDRRCGKRIRFDGEDIEEGKVVSLNGRAAPVPADCGNQQEAKVAHAKPKSVIDNFEIKFKGGSATISEAACELACIARALGNSGLTISGIKVSDGKISVS